MSEKYTHLTRRLSSAATLLNALANDRRKDILEIICEREISVGDLAKEINISQSALSQHLAKLREGHFVETRRDAQTIFYSSKSEAVKRVLAALKTISEEP